MRSAPGRGHADISNTKAAKGYGRWLTHLTRSAPKTLTETPAWSDYARDGCVPMSTALIEIGNSTPDDPCSAAGTRRGRQGNGPQATMVFHQRDWRRKFAPAIGPRAARPICACRTNWSTSGSNLMRAAENLVGLDAAITHRDGLLIGVSRADPAAPAQSRRSRPRKDTRQRRGDLDRRLRRG